MDSHLPSSSSAAHVSIGSWLRDNALTQPATLHVPVNVVRHGRSEQFFPVERSGTASESSCGMLGKVSLEIGTQWVLHTHALIAASNALVPTIFMTRVRLQACTLSAISLATFGSVFIRKCVAPIRILIVPKGCSTVSRRRRTAWGS